MARAQIRIILDIGEDSNTWVTVVPINQSFPRRSSGVAKAAGEAAAMFIENVLKDGELVAERLAALEDIGG